MTSASLSSNPSLEPDRRGPSGLLLAFAVALVLHAAGLFAVMFLRFTPEAPPGQQQISIDLSPEMQETEVQAPAEQAASEDNPEEAKPIGDPPEATDVPPPPAAEPPPPVVSEVVPEKPVEAVPPPEDTVITSQAPETEATVPPPPPVTAEAPKPPEPTPEQVAAQKAKQEEQRRKAVAEAQREAKRRAEIAERRREQIEEAREETKRQEAIKARKEAKAKSERDAARRASARNNATGRQNSAASSGRAGGATGNKGNSAAALARWKSMIAAAIRGRVSRGAANGTSGGVATVHFTVTRGGGVSGASLVSSSGVGAIDSAALSAVRGGMPPAPPGFSDAYLSVTVPLRFSPGR